MKKKKIQHGKRGERLQIDLNIYDNLTNRGQLQKPIIRSRLLTVIFPFELYFGESI